MILKGLEQIPNEGLVSKFLGAIASVGLEVSFEKNSVEGIVVIKQNRLRCTTSRNDPKEFFEASIEKGEQGLIIACQPRRVRFGLICNESDLCNNIAFLCNSLDFDDKLSHEAFIKNAIIDKYGGKETKKNIAKIEVDFSNAKKWMDLRSQALVAAGAHFESCSPTVKNESANAKTCALPDHANITEWAGEPAGDFSKDDSTNKIEPAQVIEEFFTATKQIVDIAGLNGYMLEANKCLTKEAKKAGLAFQDSPLRDVLTVQEKGKSNSVLFARN